jgi:type VI secretion system secreted protein Hcp
VLNRSLDGYLKERPSSNNPQLIDTHQLSQSSGGQQLQMHFHPAEESIAIDVYLQIDGIKGESSDSAHQGWIEVTSAQWGVTQPKSATASTGGGHTAERCEHKSIAITKLADLASPILMQTCSTGRTIPNAKLEFMRADSDGRPVKYYEVELENVLIGHMNQVAHEGNGLHDSIGLKFSKVRWKYTQQKISGGACGNTAGGWNLATNRTT